MSNWSTKYIIFYYDSCEIEVFVEDDMLWYRRVDVRR